jgi:solute carrier family 13 (sodium-dependent dicarboxylate transporter), member 2/3/5
LEESLIPNTKSRIIGFALGIVVAILILAVDNPLHHIAEGRAAAAAAIAALMAFWWLTEAVPIYITACVPILLAPLLGVFGLGFFGDLWKTILQYLDPYNFLFAGGMCIAAAMQTWNLHRRIALSIMLYIGTDPKRLLFGMLTAATFISLWLSNTACAALLFPIGLAVISQLEHHNGGKRLGFYGMAIMLSIAYGSNIGLGTKIATAPNAMFAAFMEQNGMAISFLDFMLIAMPFVIIFTPITWYWLWRIARKDELPAHSGDQTIRSQLDTLGHMKPEEKIVIGVFIATAIVWIFSEPVTAAIKPLITGYKIGSSHIEGGVAMLAAIVLFFMRHNGRQILSFKAMKGLPWATLLLMGGSFAMAAGIQEGGVSTWMGQKLLLIRELNDFSQVLLASIATVAISAVASNTATIAIMLNVLRGIVAPSLLPTVLFSSTIASSCDFALPAGTPPNAIVFGSGYVTIPQMAKTGALLDIVAAIITAILCWVLVPLVL